MAKMTPGQFKAEIERLREMSPEFMARIAPLVAANTAVAVANCFQNCIFVLPNTALSLCVNSALGL